MVKSFLISCALLLLSLNNNGVCVAQRDKDGCFDRYAPTCDRTGGAPAGIDPYDVCTRLNEAVFPNKAVYDTPSLHAEFINGVAAEDEFCDEINAVYHLCTFCGSSDFQLRCDINTIVSQCVGQPTREEVVQDNENFPLFRTEGDVDQVCQRLSEVYAKGQGDTATASTRHHGIPPTQELCVQQEQARHLCGYCDGGCFDGPTGRAPTCEPFTGTVDDNLNTDSVCNVLEQFIFPTLPFADLWNISTHEGHLKAIGEGSSLCGQAQQAYSTCFWCDPGGCFDGATGRAPTCEAYTGPVDPSVKLWEACNDLYDTISFRADPSDISLHAFPLREIEGNTAQCDVAQQAYSECFWCDNGSWDACFDDDTPNICEAPEGYLDSNFESGEAEATCDYLSTVINEQVSVREDFFDLALHRSVLNFPPNSDFCGVAQQHYHRCTWCHQAEYTPNFCVQNTECQSTATLPEDFTLPDRYSAFNLTASELNCTEMHNLYVVNTPDTSLLEDCYFKIWVSRQCPKEFCGFAPPAALDKNYLGATTVGQKKALVWTSRVAALLSFFGAAYILRDVLSTATKRKSVYYRLLFGMAIFDIITAFSWVFASAAIDRHDPAANHVFGASGNEGTCKAQAFFVQLGFTSVFYNVSLAIYYVLVIAYNRREFQLAKLQKFMHGAPIVLGLVLAFAAIPSYHWLEYGCHIEPNDLVPVLIFMVLPLSISILSITGAMVVVFIKVREQAKKSRKWQRRSGGNKNQLSSLETEVFWQGLFYALAFYISWPILFSVYLASVDINGPLAFTLVVAFVAPLQGFNNFLVFIRPKVKAYLKDRRAKRPSKNKPGSTQASSTQYTMQSTQYTVSGPSTQLGTSTVDPVDTKPSTEPVATQNTLPEAGQSTEPVVEQNAEPVAEQSTEPVPEQSAKKERFVVSDGEGNTQVLENVSDLDPSALLPLREPVAASDEEEAS